MKTFLIYLFIGLLRLFIGFVLGVAIGTALFYGLSANAASTSGQRLAIYMEVEQQSRAYRIDPDLVLAVIQVESGFDPQKLGSKGERGLMQLMPVYFPDARFDIHKNIQLGVAHLSFARANCPTKKRLTWIDCYNTGVNRHLKYPTLLPYYKAVMKAYHERKTAEVSNK